MKQKFSSVQKIYLAAKKMFKIGKPLSSQMIASKVKLSTEYVRLNVLKLVKAKLIKRSKNGRIIDVK